MNATCVRRECRIAQTVIAGLVAFSASIAVADQPAQDDLAAWITGEWAEARQLPAGATDFLLSYQTFTYAPADPSVIAALESEVAGHPDQSRMFDLVNMRRRRDNGPDTTIFKLWWGDTHVWRLSTTILYQPMVPYVDYGVCPRSAWMLSPGQLTTLDPAGGNVENYDAVIPNAGYRWYANLAIHGGFDREEGLCKPGAPVLADDGTWRMRAASADSRVVFEYRGRWRADIGRGFVDSIECVKAVVPSAVGERWEFTDWQPLPAINTYAARTVEYFEPPSHSPHASWQLLRCGKIDRAQIERAAAMPNAWGMDPDRGPLTFTRVFGAKEGHDLPFAGFVGPDSKADADLGTRRWGSARSIVGVLGWVCFGGLVLVLAAMKARSHWTKRAQRPWHSDGAS